MRPPPELQAPYPRQGDGVFIPRLGRTSTRIDALLRSRAISVTAHPLLGYQRDRQLRIGEPARLVALDPACRHNQQLPARRPAGFSDLVYAREGDLYKPDAGIDEAAARRYVEEVLSAEVEAGASLLLPPAHQARGWGSVGRHSELLFQRLAAEFFREEGMRRPGADDPHEVGRVLYANVMMQMRALRGHAGRTLLAQYVGLQVDGFWVSVADLTERASPDDVAAAAEWLFRLQVESGLPVILVGAANLHLAFWSAASPARA